MSCGLVSPGSVFVTVAQSAKCKVCCLWHNVFHFDGSMRDEHFFNLSVSSPFFFLDIYFFNKAVLFCYFFTGVPMLCELEIWVLELLMRFAQPRFADIFTRKYQPVTCNLVNTLKLSVIIPAEAFIRLFYPFLHQRKPELTQFKLCLPGGSACHIPHPWPDRWIRQQSRNIPPRSPSVIKADLLNPYCLCVRYNNVPMQISGLLF